MSPKWDKHSILAEIHRRGETLSSMERKNNLKPGLWVVFQKPFPKAEGFISLFLGVPLHELWPDRYVSSLGGVSSRPLKLAESDDTAKVKSAPVKLTRSARHG